MQQGTRDRLASEFEQRWESVFRQQWTPSMMITTATTVMAVTGTGMVITGTGMDITGTDTTAITTYWAAA
ncbi:Hypp6045 [Branchiostoma lanceolatum]|uniref:Hypp6045 protein n=1 Tax=Branchiostoma lanceolatum TaxID=7740 RepID=A0A8J9VLV1_BRALA|nr:Hypp6045 [Branchiostoma lanceolatum]